MWRTDYGYLTFSLTPGDESATTQRSWLLQLTAGVPGRSTTYPWDLHRSPDPSTATTVPQPWKKLRLQDDLDASVFLVAELLVGVGRFFQRESVSDDK